MKKILSSTSQNISERERYVFFYKTFEHQRKEGAKTVPIAPACILLWVSWVTQSLERSSA